MVTRGKTYHDRKADYRKRCKEWKMKGWTFPQGFTVLQDTREQKSPLLSRLPSGLCIMSTCLPVGDYSIQGHESRFAIERKQLSDFCTYVGVERDKTVIKMEKMAEMEWAGLVVEVDEDKLIRPQEFSKIAPETIRQALVSFEVRYGIHLYLNSDRDAVARWMIDRMLKFYQIKREVG